MSANMSSNDVCCICLDALDADGHFGCMGLNGCVFVAFNTLVV